MSKTSMTTSFKTKYKVWSKMIYKVKAGQKDKTVTDFTFQ